jgi:hypothetical protein
MFIPGTRFPLRPGGRHKKNSAYFKELRYLLLHPLTYLPDNAKSLSSTSLSARQKLQRVWKKM